MIGDILPGPLNVRMYVCMLNFFTLSALMHETLATQGLLGPRQNHRHRFEYVVTGIPHDQPPLNAVQTYTDRHHGTG
jgi:hypothetical protein